MAELHRRAAVWLVSLRAVLSGPLTRHSTPGLVASGRGWAGHERMGCGLVSWCLRICPGWRSLPGLEILKSDLKLYGLGHHLLPFMKASAGGASPEEATRLLILEYLGKKWRVL